MSRRIQPVIEEFDDDTDLPLPSRPLPNTGERGAILQAVDSDDEDVSDSGEDVFTRGWPQHPGPASPSNVGAPFGAAQQQPGAPVVTDLTPYKKWTCIYPIYLDAKRPFGTGSRRIARPKAVWWPLSKDIADAALRLGLSTLHEMQKCHPQDWENPGRVRVLWKKDGRLVNERIRTKKQLLEEIASYIQRVKPELIPKPPFASNYKSRTTVAAATTSSTSKAPSKTPATSSASKGPSKQVAKGSKTTKPKPQAQTKEHKPIPRTPRPPKPQPPLASRVSAYSPALPSGVLVETLKAGMNAAAEAGGPLAGIGGKGKRKVVRVRG